MRNQSLPLPRSLVNAVADFGELQQARANYIKRQNGVYTRAVVEKVKLLDETMRDHSTSIHKLGMKTGHDILTDKELRDDVMCAAHDEIKHRHEERRRSAAARNRVREEREEEESTIDA